MKTFGFLLLLVVEISSAFEIKFEYTREKCLNDMTEWEPSEKQFISKNPLGPIVECEFLDASFISCDEPIHIFGGPGGANGQTPANETFRNEGKCLHMGGYRAEDIEFTNVKCRVLPCIECKGPRTFLKLTPCIIYTGHYFLTTLLYSIFLGVIAVDRFCLGYSAMAVGKLMTLGGFGIWWIVDIFLLVLGGLGPADESNWEPNY